jgi:hypothetical protein
MFALNAYYFFAQQASWQWFMVAGLVVIQEIDIDLEGASSERSFSGSGDIGGNFWLE